MYVIRRSTHNPLLVPVPDYSWQSLGTFNGCPVEKDGTVHLLYRAMGRSNALSNSSNQLSSIGKAISSDGEHFRGWERFLVPDTEWDCFGCEDPRVTRFEGKYYIFYTAISEMPPRAEGIRVGVAVSSDLKTVEEKHLITPFNAKAMALFPERIRGKVAVLFSMDTDRPPEPVKMMLVACDEISDLWDAGFWESWKKGSERDRITGIVRRKEDHVEVGAPPLKTKEGWLMIYSYIQDYYRGMEKRTVGIEGVLLDSEDPRKIIGRTKGPILTPEEVYERYGMVPDVVFPSGTLLSSDGRLDIYYGGADTTCAKASLNLDDLLGAMMPERRSSFVKRSPGNPLLEKNPEHAWEAKAAFNPAAVEIGKKIHILYRAMSRDNTSSMGYAMSRDGMTLSEVSDTPAYLPRESFEMKPPGSSVNSGCEDARLTKIGRTIYMTYTAYDGAHNTRVALSKISAGDFAAKRWGKWSIPVLLTPPHVNEKNLCIFPKKIRGKYMILHRIDPVICADFAKDLSRPEVTRCIEVMGPRPGTWDSRKIGIAAPPLETKEGWLLIYHGVSRSKTYRLGAALLDRKDPTKLLARTEDPILEPVEEYEKVGQEHNVVFSCGAVIRGKDLFVYYGGADQVVCAAQLPLMRLLRILKPKNL